MDNLALARAKMEVLSHQMLAAQSVQFQIDQINIMTPMLWIFDLEGDLLRGNFRLLYSSYRKHSFAEIYSFYIDKYR